MNKKQELVNIGVDFQAISCTLLRAKLPNINYQIVAEGNSVNSIIYEDKCISIGDNYCCNVSSSTDSHKINYKVNTITINSEDKRVVNLFEGIPNNTSLFALPMIIDDKKESGYIIGNTGYLINAFIDCDFEKSTSSYSIFVLLKFMQSGRFKIQEKIYASNENFIRAIDVDKNHVLYEFLIPEKFHDDFDLLLEGKYSKLSNKAANQILTFHGDDIEGRIIYKAINKDPKFKQALADDFMMDVEDIGELYKAFDHNDILSKNML